MKARKKIRLIVNAIPLVNVNTGIGRYLRCLYSQIEALYRNELEVSYFDGNCISERMPSGPTDWDKRVRRVSLFWRLPGVPALHIRVIFHAWREARFRKAARGYDLYHEAAFFPFAPVPGAKTVFTIQDLSLLRCPEFHPRERVLFSRLFFRRRCNTVERFLTISHFSRREIEDLLGLSDPRISVTHLAHDRSIFYPRTPRETEEVRTRLSIPSRYFIFVGNGDPRKNRQVIPEAIRAAGIDTPLVAVGWSGWSKNQIEEEKVIHLGYIPDEDLAKLYSGAAALVYPSLYEGFGLPVLEAMACGCPVVCSRSASLPEAAGDAALYLENPLDPLELAALLDRITSEPGLREKMSRDGLAHASRFSWEKTARETFDVFMEALGRKPART